MTSPSFARLRAVGLLLLFLPLFAACGGTANTDPIGDCFGLAGCECSGPSDCSTGLQCVERTCTSSSSSGSGGTGGGSGGATTSGGGTTPGEGGANSSQVLCTGTPSGNCASQFCDTLPGCNVVEPAVCEGTPPPCSSFDDDRRGCDGHWGCGIGALGVCYNYSTRCGSADDYEECVERSGCDWIDFACQGTVIDCATLPSQTRCEADGACRWDASEVDYCGGIAGACEDRISTDCEAHTGCTLTQAECDGTRTPCEELTEGADCVAQTGCSWSGQPVSMPSPAGVETPLPDLVPDVFFASRVEDAGTWALQLRLSAINRGHVEAAPSVIQFVLSEDAEIGNDDDRELYSIDANEVGPYGRFVLDTGVFALDMEEIEAEHPAGNYTVAVVLDYGQEVDEFDEGNNVAIDDEPVFIGLPKFDLAATEATHDVDAELAPGTAFDVTVTVENTGSEPVETVPVAVYFSEDDTFDDDDVEACRADLTLDSLPGDSTTLPIDCAAPRARGDFQVLVVVDPDDTIGDVNPDDNTAIADGEVTVDAPEPNLVINSVSSNVTSVAWQGEVTFTAEVENVGVDAAGDSSVGFYVDGTLVCTEPAGALDPDATSTVTSTCTLPASLSGALELTARADSSDVVFETDETDNELAADDALDIAAPDFNLEAMGVSFMAASSVAAGDTVTLEMTVGSTGDDEAPSFYVEFYLSLDETIDGSDDVLCFTTRNALASGTAETFAVECTLPTVDDGDYYVGAIVDPEDEVPESSESDNVSRYDTFLLTVAN